MIGRSVFVLGDYLSGWVGVCVWVLYRGEVLCCERVWCQLILGVLFAVGHRGLGLLWALSLWVRVLFVFVLSSRTVWGGELTVRSGIFCVFFLIGCCYFSPCSSLFVLRCLCDVCGSESREDLGTSVGRDKTRNPRL